MGTTLRPVAIYGGVFDPLHAGHRSIIEWLLRHDWCTWIVPTARPYHKPDGPSQSFDQRMTTLETFLRSLPAAWQAQARILTAENDNPDIAGRTHRLLQHLETTEGPQRWSLAVGADEWYKLEHWYRLPDWFTAVDWIVFPRYKPWDASRWHLPSCAQRSSYQIDIQPQWWRLHSSHHSIQFVNCPLSDHSSTALRST